VTLTEQQKKLVEQKIAKATCQICGSKGTYRPSENIIGLRHTLPFDPNAASPDPSSLTQLPAIILICENCGQIVLLSTQALGITSE